MERRGRRRRRRRRRRKKKRGRGMQTRQVIVKGKDTDHMMASSLSPWTVPNSEFSLP